MSLRNRLLEKQQEKKVPWNVIELDYALSWVLAAMGEYKPAKEHFIFKGGTCLKKCYFGQHYRFSEDLDFSVDPHLSDPFLDDCLEQITLISRELSARLGGGLQFSYELYQEKESHPFQQRAYILRAQFPWHRSALIKIKVEMSRDEKLIFEPQERTILHEYGEDLRQTIRSYALEEILLEKYRAILQNQERLKIKGWIRSRVRDYYDLWQILKHFKTQLDLSVFKVAFVEKCAIKGIDFEGVQQFFNQKDYLQKVQQDWETYLGDLIADLPCFELMLRELEVLTAQVFKE
jgi:predicted nucleotidyltransferase component of viral defense system